MEELISKANVLIEALPYIRMFKGRTVLVKYGGKAMTSDELKKSFAQDIVLMKFVGINPVIVHGAGPQISEMMEKMGKKAQFVDGLRVTDKETIDIVEMVMTGKINKEIVSLINQQGGQAVGLSGKDGKLISGKKLPPRNNVDLGYVGEIESIHPEIIKTLDLKHFIPVIAPVAVSAEGDTLNINADTAAAELAASLKVDKLVFLTDVPGIYSDVEKKHIIPSITAAEVHDLIEKKVISSGMIPKVKSMMLAVEAGVRKAHIIDGRISHALLLEIFTDKGIGTEIIK